MNTKKLALDYLERAKKRMKALEILLEMGANADAIREAQEIVELILKGVARYVGIEPPKKHDVGAILKENKEKLPKYWQDIIDEVEEVSKKLYEERSHAFYGDEEDLTPASELFTEEDAFWAKSKAEKFLSLFEKLVKEGN